MKVEQLYNKNQFIIDHKRKKYFQSYDSLICIFDEYNKKGKHLILIDNMWDYSNTTRKHFKLFINEYTYFRYQDKKSWLRFLEMKPKSVIIKDSE